MMRLTTILALAVCFMKSVAAECIYQACVCQGTQIMCQHLGLSDIPPLVGTTPDYSELMFDTNNITTIRAGSLPKHLKRFRAYINPLTTIDSSAFIDSASTLEDLELSKFLFTRVPDAFLNLTNLKSITMYDASIVDWNLNVMRNIGPTVLNLDLKNVGFVAWPAWIQYFSNLTSLSLDNGGISSLPDNALDMLANSLTWLSINNNSLTVIPKTVSTLKALRTLALYNNQIIDVSWLPHLSNLTTLGLSSNRLFNATQFSLSLRPLAGTLFAIDLLENQFTGIPDLSFLKLIYGFDFRRNQLSDLDGGPLPDTIYELELGYNFFQRIPDVFSKLPRVSDLFMARNVITEIQAADFSPWILRVDLTSNLIVELTDTSFPPNSSIINLNLDNNPIATISKNVFNNLLQLTYLSMSNTNITYLPVGLSVLTNINLFEIDGNTNLVCTCMEKSLAQWILSRPIEVDGYCGLSTIHNFFYSLSQFCM